MRALLLVLALGACHTHAKPAPVVAEHVYTAADGAEYFRAHCPHLQCARQTDEERSFAEVAGVKVAP